MPAKKKKPASSDDAGACAHCERHEPTLSSCSRCGLVKYCSRDCQRAHWKEHKPLCIPKADRIPQPVRTPQVHLVHILQPAKAKIAPFVWTRYWQRMGQP